MAYDVGMSRHRILLRLQGVRAGWLDRGSPRQAGMPSIGRIVAASRRARERASVSRGVDRRHLRGVHVEPVERAFALDSAAEGVTRGSCATRDQ